MLGPRLAELAAAAGEDRLLAAAGPVLAHLRDHTGESAQLYRRQGDQRICVAAAERPVGLRDTVPVGAALPMLGRLGRPGAAGLGGARPPAPRAARRASSPRPRSSGVRRRGWAQSVGEREPGVASVSAPVRGPSGRVVAAVSVSGPIERLTRQPGPPARRRRSIAGANKLTEVLARHHAQQQQQNHA